MNEEIVLEKDDRELFAMIERGRELRRVRDIPEPEEEFNPREATKGWQEMRQARATRRTYHIIIEPSDGFYRAYPLAVPQVVAQGETPQAAKENVAEALRTYLLELLAQGKPLPLERKLVDTIAISLT